MRWHCAEASHLRLREASFCVSACSAIPPALTSSMSIARRALLSSSSPGSCSSSVIAAGRAAISGAGADTATGPSTSSALQVLQAPCPSSHAHSCFAVRSPRCQLPAGLPARRHILISALSPRALSCTFSSSLGPSVPRIQLVHTHRRVHAAAMSGQEGAPGGRGSNRLAQEHSPYLLQHAHNPVEWYPWGEEAFRKARAENKLIFLSVGYSTCHWCHVMERESFESEEVAAIMNQGFVNVKVDREERPDVDKVYMTYVQATQGGGGWPMSVFLTPSLHPVLGGTYFPPEDGYGRPGFKTLLRRVLQVWRERPKELEENGRDVMRQLLEATEPGPGEGSLPNSLPGAALLKCCDQLSQRFDRRLGGFGSAPKFPRPAELNALLRRYHWGRQFPDEGGRGQGAQEGQQCLDKALFTLRCMGWGGMHDHIGGGFHRYSVDEYWHVPHFEKMLYDQGQLANSYLDAYAATGDDAYASTARDILDYVLRSLTHPEGGFFSAEDADSLDGAEKKEGAFYVWTQQEIEGVLGRGSERSRLLMRHYCVKAGGNCDLSPRSDPHGEFQGKNCLIQRLDLEESAREEGMEESEAARVLAACRELLHRARSARPHPHLDDKVIVAWNGLMISAFARASRILQAEASAKKSHYFPVTGCDPSTYLTAASRAANFIRERLYDPATMRLRRSFRGAPSAAAGFADDYAFLISALLDLFECSGGDTTWLHWAMELQETQDSEFWDAVGGGYYSTPKGDPSILLRLKEDYDGAEPSANSYSVANLARLSHYVGGEKSQQYLARGQKTAAAFHERLSKVPLALPQMCAFLPLLGAPTEPRQVVIAGPRGDEDTDALVTAALTSPSPDKIVIAVDTESSTDVAFWSKQNPAVLRIAGGEGRRPESPGDAQGKPKAAAFVCQNFTCLAPTSDAAALRSLVDRPQGLSGVEVAEMKL